MRSSRTDATGRGGWPGSPDEDDEPRTFWERIAEFNDPQRALGGGISSYHQQLVHLFFLFLVLALMHIVHMEVYTSYSFYGASRTQASQTLGNLGFSQVHCLIEGMQKASSEAAVDELDLKCASGTIAAVRDFGITTMFEDQQACSRKASV